MTVRRLSRWLSAASWVWQYGRPGDDGRLYNSTYEIVQSDDYVMIAVEMAHDARIIPVFDSAEEARANRRPAVLKQWLEIQLVGMRTVCCWWKPSISTRNKWLRALCQ